MHRVLFGSVFVALFAAFALTAPAAAQLPANPYDRPWRHDATTIVVDTYEGNALDWDALARDPRVAGVIHRASIGNVVDAAYAARAAEARRRGMLWGAYHLGVEGDPVGQADLFLRTVGDTTSVLLVLDLEDVDDPRHMNADEAITFMERVRARTGRAPVLYGNVKVVASLSEDPRYRAIARETPLWYARYRDNIEPGELGPWNAYLLWQFASEINCLPRSRDCPYAVDGIDEIIDYNVFPGSRAELRQLWATGGAPAPFLGPFAEVPLDDDEAAERAIQLEAQRRETERLKRRASVSCAATPPPTTTC